MNQKQSEWYCYECPFDKNAPYLGPWTDDDEKFFSKIKSAHGNHNGFSASKPEKSLEESATETLLEMNPIQKIIDSAKSKKEDLLEEVVAFSKKEILQESDNICLVFLNGLSAYSANPINLRILAPSSEGKTYLVNQIASLFPKKDVMNLSTASSQSFKYLEGEAVIETEAGGFEPIESRLIQLEMDLLDKTKSKQELESIKREIFELNKKSWHMIDLSNKWLIFSDSQNEGLWEMLKTTISHDAEYIKHQVTNKIGGKNTAQRIVFKGKPAITYCSAKDESKHRISEEMDTRFHTIYLRTNPQKYKDSINLLSQKYGLPKEIYESEVVSESEKTQAVYKLNLLIENVKQYGSEVNCMFNPFAAEIANNFPSEDGLRSRQFGRFNQYITLMTICYSSSRPKIKIKDRHYPVVTKKDILRTINIMKETATIPTNKIQFFNDVIRPAMIGIQNKEEYRVGINGCKYAMTSGEISYYEKSIHKKSNQNRKKILENYLKPLSEHGFLEISKDPRDKKRNIYWLAKQYETKKADLESTLIDISTLSDSGVRAYIERYIKRRFDSKELTILDKDNQIITPEQLHGIVTSIDIQTPQNRHDFDDVETSTDVEDK